MTEFDLIARYFVPLTQGHAEAGGLQSDTAVLDIPAGRQLVVTSDTLVAGVHFLPHQSPRTIAQKALRTNISDLLAGGARPYCYQLCLSIPKANEIFFADFTAGLAADQEKYGIFLSGGDTTSTPGPLSISITAMGLVDTGKAITRSGARPGDLIALSGPVGDAWCGLEALRGNLLNVPPSCIALYEVPNPPYHLLDFLPGSVNAAADISDGLVADLSHIAKASDLSAIIELSKITYSPAVQGLLEAGAVSHENLLTGGDDYQLVMAVAPENIRALGDKIQVIGRFESGMAGIRILDNAGKSVDFSKSGWRHF